MPNTHEVSWASSGVHVCTCAVSAGSYKVANGAKAFSVHVDHSQLLPIALHKAWATPEPHSLGCALCWINSTISPPSEGARTELGMTRLCPNLGCVTDEEPLVVWDSQQSVQQEALAAATQTNRY